MYVFIIIKKYIYTYSVKKCFCMCVIMTSQSIIRIQIFTVIILKFNTFSLIIIKQFYPRLLCSHRIYKNMYWSDQKVIMYIIEKFGDYKIQNYNPTIFVEILMGKLAKSSFISSYNGSSGRTKMVIADVKMQTGWIPVCIERFIMNKYNKFTCFILSSYSLSLSPCFSIHVSGSNKCRYEVIFTRSLLPTNQEKASTALENLKGERHLIFFLCIILY